MHEKHDMCGRDVGLLLGLYELKRVTKGGINLVVEQPNKLRCMIDRPSRERPRRLRFRLRDGREVALNDLKRYRSRGHASIKAKIVAKSIVDKMNPTSKVMLKILVNQKGSRS